jgi:predicted unusual protein kinase regulating ubiquinone biosynthesis (AarF/ABC1/UbiB family)
VPRRARRKDDAPLRLHARHLPEPTTADEVSRGSRIVLAMLVRLGPQLAGIARRRERGEVAVLAAAHGLRLAFQDLGGTFVKFGQLVASSPGLFGPKLAEEFRSCLDTGPAVPMDEVRAYIEDELGVALEDVFEHFDPVPIGRASIAVVHRARMRDGRDVAVKVLRP